MDINNTDADTLSDQIESYQNKLIQEAKKNITAPPPDKMFEPLKAQQERAGLQVQETILAVEQIANKGITALLQALREMKKETEAEEIESWISENASSMIQILQAETKEDESTEQKVGFPRNYLNLMHQASEYLRVQKRYDEAVAGMTICLFFNSGIYDLWFTYGQILQDKGDMSEALYAYCFASLIDEKNPYPYLYSVKPWLMLGNWKKAEDSLKEASNCCKASEKHSELLNYCQVLDKWLLSKKGQFAG